MAEADRVLNGVTHNEVAENAKIIKDYIFSKGLKKFKTKEIRDGLLRRIQDDDRSTKTQKIKLALNELAEEGFLCREVSGRGETWVVNQQASPNVEY